MENSIKITLEGVVVEGLGESNRFTCLAWVKEQLVSNLGIDPFPGTFNLKIMNKTDLQRYHQLKRRRGISIAPREPGFCPAKAFPVLVDKKIQGAIIIPLVTGYPEDKLEIVSASNIRETLGLKNGDSVKFEVNL